MRATIKEYASALFALAQEEALEKRILQELRVLSEVFDSTPEYPAFLDSPCVPMSERLETVERSFGEDFAEFTVSFLSLLCEQGGASLLPECAEEYERLYNEKNRVSRAKVTSASPLDGRQRKALTARLEELSGCRIEIDYATDPSLLGGVTVEMDGLLIDGSLRGRLKNIREVMGE